MSISSLFIVEVLVTRPTPMDQRRKPFARLLSLHTECSKATSTPATTKIEEPSQPPESVPVATNLVVSTKPNNAACATVSMEEKHCKSTNKQRRSISQSVEEPPSFRDKGKHAGPVEMSLTRRVPPPLWKLHKKAPSGRVVRDPRFDDVSGKLDMAAFSKNYQFLAEMRDKERVTLKKALSRAANPQDRLRAKLAIQRIDNQEREKNKFLEERRRKKIEKEALISSLKEGRRPYVKKKSEQKLEVLCEKFQALKKEKRLDKYLERKEKKKRAKELFK
ncbi:rRNA biogenesis protein RRP36 [Trinorchestia longiramus]|nr:rRNA biogenesis protein RRP36 [Trinorchestia longiramus]